MKYAVIKTGGKQYIVSENQEIIVDKINLDNKSQVNFETLAIWDSERDDIQLGQPILKSQVKGEIIKQMKGEKIRVTKFRSKVRYRRVQGFRPLLTKIKILEI